MPTNREQLAWSVHLFCVSGKQKITSYDTFEDWFLCGVISRWPLGGVCNASNNFVAIIRGSMLGSF